MLDGVTKVGDLKKSLEFVLRWEGGYVCDPDDPGGETKWGICKASHPNEDIKNLTPVRALAIYAQEYWLPSGADALEYPESTVVFDSAVQHGVKRAAKWLKECKDVHDYLDIRAKFYVEIIQKNPVQAKFQRGWFNRLNDLRKLVIIAEGGVPKERPVVQTSWWAKYL